MVYEVVTGQIARAEDINQLVRLAQQTFNVTSYGATGDGLTNDSAAVQAAIDAASVEGGIVFLPPGAYVAYGLEVEASNVALVGAGKGVTRLLNTANGEGIWVHGTSGAHLLNVAIRDLSVISDLGDGNQRCVFLDYADDSVVENCHLEGAGNNALNIYHGTNVRVRGNDISGCKNYGVLVYLAESVSVTDNRIHDFSTTAPDGHFGLEFKDSLRCVASGNRFADIAGGAIQCFGDGLSPDGHHVVTNNVIEGLIAGGSQSATAIVVNTSDHDLISGNHMACGPGGGGISVAATTGTSVTGNRVMGSPGAGIGLSAGATLCSVADNVISDCVQGIYVSGVTRNSFSGNHIQNNQLSGDTLASMIHVLGGATYNEFIDNRCIDNRGGASTTFFGILEESGDYNIFSLNRCFGATTANVAITGAHSVNLNNDPYLTSPGVFNVKDYGAKGDASTDDTAAIIATFAALPANGGEVYFPPGTYLVYSTITIDGLVKPVIVRGSGQGLSGSSTRILWVGGAAPVFVVPSSGPSGMTFRDLMIDNTTTGTIAVKVDGVNMFTMRNVLIYPQVPFSDCGIALGTVSNVVGASFYDTIVRHCNVGMRAEGVGSHLYSVGLRCVESTGPSLILGTATKTCDSAHFYGGTFENYNGTTPVQILRVRNASFDGCYFEHGGSSYAIDIPSSAVIAWAVSVNSGFFAGNDGSGAATYAVNLNHALARFTLRDSFFVGYANPSYMVRNQASGRLTLTDNDGVATGMLQSTSFTNVTATGHWGDPVGNLPDRLRPFNIAGGSTITGHFTGTTTWDPPSLGPSGFALKEVPCPGAALGDTVTCGFNLHLEYMMMTAFVDRPDVVTVMLFNPLAVTRDLANGTLRVDVWKH